MKVYHKTMMAVIVAILVPIAVRAEQDGALRRLTPPEIAALERGGPGAGTSGVVGIHTTILAGEPPGQALYPLRLRVPANKRIEAHGHRDDLSATVVSGTWYFG